MNILFVLYGDFDSNSANPLVLYARELQLAGHACAIAVPSNLETVSQHANPAFVPILYRDVLAAPDSVFPDGRPADVIHACTPREVVRHFVMSYMDTRPTPLVIYLEDNESWISTRTMGLDENTLVKYPEKEICERLPESLAHPFRYRSFIGLADAVATIQEKLKLEVPPWVHCETVMIGVDIDFFSPRSPDASLRVKYGVAEHEKVIVYHGGLDNFKKAAIETLCNAVGLINRQGYPCRLLRTGLRPLAFLEQMPKEVAASISDLGVLPKQDLPDLLALADVFVQPGQIDLFEDLRLPGKVPEFLAMGRPVVMPSVNIAHLFSDGLDAVLLRSGTAEEIAAKCIGLFSDPRNASMIGRAGRNVAEKYFDVRKQARRLEDVYKTACCNFNPAIASEIWRTKDEDNPIGLLVARRLRLLADVRAARSDFHASEMLKEHARYIELMERRVRGLETTMAERDRPIASINQALVECDGQIARLTQALAERDGQIAALRESTSWRITAPIRALRNALLWARVNCNAIHIRASNIFRNRNLRSRSLPAGSHGPHKRAGHQSSTLSPRSDPTHSHVADYSKWQRLHAQSRRMRWHLPDNTYQQSAGKSIGFSIVAYVTGGSPTERICRFADSLKALEHQRWRLRLIVTDEATEAIAREGTRAIASKTSIVRLDLGAGCFSVLPDVLGEGDEWVIILRTLGAIEPDALTIIAYALNDRSHASLVYADSDLMVGTRRATPYLKPEFDLDLLRSQDYLSDLVAYRADILRQLGQQRGLDWRLWLWNINLCVVERAGPKSVVHVREVLFSAFSETEQPPARHRFVESEGYAALRVIESHLQRVKERATAELTGSRIRVRYAPPSPPPLVSVIIPTRDAAGLLRQCMMRLMELTTYQPYEVIVVDNGSRELDTFSLFDTLRKQGVRIISYAREFNFSAINNLAAREARGDVLVFLNNDIEPISADWLDEMVGLACRADVGAVGAMLYYPSEAIQHAGVILGIEGVAAHAFAGLPRGADGDNGRAQCVQRYSAVTAACLAVRKSVFKEAGGFDEHNLPVAFNDVDLCLRIASFGYRNVWTPMAELYHHESASRGRDDATRNRARFAKEVQYMKNRWSNVLQEDPAYNPNLTRSGAAFGGYRIA